MFSRLAIPAFVITFVFCSCNASRHYFNKRIGGRSERESTKHSPEKKTSDTLTRRVPPPTYSLEKPIEQKKPAMVNDTNRVQPAKPQEEILKDSIAKVNSLGNEDMFNFEAARKKYKEPRFAPGVLASVLLLLFVALAILVFIAGLYIYRTQWKIGKQNLAFFLVILFGTVLCKKIMQWWNNAAYGK